MTDPSSPGRAGDPRRPVELEVTADAAELLADRLFALGASAVGERPGRDGSVVLVADVDPTTLVGADGSPVAELHGVSGVRVLEPDPAWDTGWHGGASRWTCGERLAVRPHWVDPPSAAPLDTIEVVVDPGTSFGAGSHPTTRSCLAALEPLANGAGSVLDVGCGTGVLGIAALLLGAQELTAIDVDPAAIAATASALRMNSVADRARVELVQLPSVQGTFDLVLANLLIPLIEDLGTELVAHLAPGGSLVVGGLLSHQFDRALAALEPLQPVRRTIDGDWVTAVMGHR